jgi:hypothetical protein
MFWFFTSSIRGGSDKITASDFVQIVGKKWRPWQWLDNCSGRKSEVKSILIIFCDIKGIVHKEFVLADQEVNSAHCCDILWRLHENVRRLHLELWQQKNWLLQMTTHHFTLPFSPRYLWPQAVWLSSLTHCTRLIWPSATLLCSPN